MTLVADMSPLVKLKIDGVFTRAVEGQTLAALLIAPDVHARGRTPEGKSRERYAALGSVPACIVTVDGVARVNTCLTPVRQGIQILAHRKASRPGLPLQCGSRRGGRWIRKLGRRQGIRARAKHGSSPPTSTPEAIAPSFSAGPRPNENAKSPPKARSGHSQTFSQDPALIPQKGTHK